MRGLRNFSHKKAANVIAYPRAKRLSLSVEKAGSSPGTAVKAAEIKLPLTVKAGIETSKTAQMEKNSGTRKQAAAVRSPPKDHAATKTDAEKERKNPLAKTTSGTAAAP